MATKSLAIHLLGEFHVSVGARSIKDVLILHGELVDGVPPKRKCGGTPPK